MCAFVLASVRIYVLACEPACVRVCVYACVFSRVRVCACL